jgi:ATP-binding cassette subfamily F protein uup
VRRREQGFDGFEEWRETTWAEDERHKREIRPRGEMGG